MISVFLRTHVSECMVTLILYIMIIPYVSKKYVSVTKAFQLVSMLMMFGL